MFAYQKKRIRVQAVQWGKGLTDMPLWLVTALDLTNNRLYKRIRQVGDVLCVDGKKVSDGNWIVYYAAPAHELEVYSDDEFRKVFEVDEGRQPRIRSWAEKEERNKQ